MKKLFKMALPLMCGMFVVSACNGQKKEVKNAEETAEPAKITWIEDKPGPSFQDHKIFPEVSDSLWEALGLQEGVPSSMSCVLLETEGKKILVDAGLGAPFSQLLPKLAEAGIKPEDLKLIYITHLHQDHIGGLLNEGKVVFPNADVYINRVEAEAWKNMPEEKSAGARQVLEAYSAKLHEFEAGDTLQGGVVSMAAYGHTPGHTIFQKDSILIIADLMHGAALQLEHPEYCPFYDMDPVEATASRIRILEYARKNGLTMYGMHLPAPGFVK